MGTSQAKPNMEVEDIKQHPFNTELLVVSKKAKPKTRGVASESVKYEPTTLDDAFINRPWLYGGISSDKWTQGDFMKAPYVDIRDDKQKDAIDLVRVKFVSWLSGLLSKTTVVMTFYNHHTSDLEGNLSFPLPDGAIVSGYGLDVNGEIVQASIVEKQKARQVFEQEVKKRVDPGLIEMVKGNVFNTRIYPLPARGTRTISVTYIVELTSEDTKSLNFKHPLLLFKPVILDLEVNVLHDTGSYPVFVSKDLEEVTFKAHNQSSGTSFYTARYVSNDFRSESRSITIHIPYDESHDRVFVEKAPHDDTQYFVIQDLIPTVDQSRTVSNVQIDKVAVFWDTSLSRDSLDKSRELAIFQKFVSKLSNATSITIIPFNYKLEKPTHFKASDGDLLKYLHDLVYDGCTRLDQLTLSAEDKYDLVLLFTDGMNAIGEDSPDLSKFPPTYIVSGENSNGNHVLLNYFASQTGGVYFNLNKIGDNESVVQQMVSPATLSMISVVASNPQDVSGVYPRGHVSLASKGNYLTVSGKLKGNTTITINYGYGKHNVVTSSQHKLVVNENTGTGLIPLIWAQQKLEYLSALEEKNKEKILKLGRKFGLVTSGTSLLVLETLEQHLEHNIEPHPSRTKLYESFLANQKSQEEELEITIQNKLSKVREWWSDRINWWNTEFTYQPPREESSKKRKRMANDNSEMFMDSLSFDSCRESAPMTLRSVEMAECMVVTSCLEDGEDCEEMDASFGSSAIPGGSSAIPDVSVGASVSVKYWDPNTPYLNEIKEAKKENQYQVYLQQRRNYKDVAAFYLDCSHHFFHHHEKSLGVKILSNILELKLESSELLRMVGYKLDEQKEYDLAIEIFSKILKLRPDEPQSSRDLALVLEKIKEYQRAVDLLWAVISGPNWSSSYEQIEVTALYELNNILEKAQGYRNYFKRLGSKPPQDYPTTPISLPYNFDPSIWIHNIDVDLRISMAWDTDNTDIDLHVQEPTGEECYYAYQRTRIGGLCSRDFRNGYGPEEYMLKKAYPGEYIVKANYYASHQASLTGPTTILLGLFTNFGRPTQQLQMSTIRLAESKNNAEIGRITIQP